MQENEKQNDKRSPVGRHVPVALGVAGGTGLGLFVGRAMAGPGSAALAKLAETLATQAALQTAGPIIGAAITGGCSILAGVAVPLAVMWAISKQGKDA